jgi:hypothetical protein
VPGGPQVIEKGVVLLDIEGLGHGGCVPVSALQ